MTLAEIKDKKLTCVVHTKSKTEATILTKYMPQKNWRKNPLDYWDVYSEETGYYIEDGQLFQFSPVSFYKKEYPRFGKIYEFSDLFATGGTVSIHNLPTSEWYNPMRLTFKNGLSIEALPLKDDAVRGKNHFCNEFRGGKIPTPENPVSIDIQPLEFVYNKEQAKELAERLDRELAGLFNAFPNDGISAKNGGKNSMKFTFYVTEGTRVDKSCNGTIPTMTTTVEANGYSRTAPVGTATCDKADYDMRQGVLEALANMYCDGDFDKAFNKAVKRNELADKKKRTCTYCGKVFDTVEECEAEEAWHVERKKAKRERYLLRRRAKEIAFEEQAQKMAKEMIKEDK